MDLLVEIYKQVENDMTSQKVSSVPPLPFPIQTGEHFVRDEKHSIGPTADPWRRRGSLTA